MDSFLHNAWQGAVSAWQSSANYLFGSVVKPFTYSLGVHTTNLMAWYMNGEGGLGGWVDNNVTFGTVGNAGNAWGEADSGVGSYGRAWALTGVAGGATVFAAFNIEDAGTSLISLFERGCFVAGTPVQMADGTTKPIEQVKDGDMVLSRDQNAGENGKLVAARVMRPYQHEHPTSQMVIVTLSSGERIECTDNHPFYVPGTGWVPAGRLCLGTLLSPRAGPTAAGTLMGRATVVGVERCAAKAGTGTTVYNFEVEGTHTYFVGSSNGGEWVHNTCPLLRAQFNKVVRPEFWKETGMQPGPWTPSEVERMLSGKAPIGPDGYPYELHHITPLDDGGTNDFGNLQIMTRTDHRLGPNYILNHPNVGN